MFFNLSKLAKPIIFLLVFLLVFLIVESTLVVVLLSNYSQEKQNYTNELTERLETVVNAVVNIYGSVARAVFQEVVNKPEIIDLFKHAHTSNVEQQAVIRK